MQKAITTLLERKPTWEQVLEWLMDEARRFPSARGAHQTRTSPCETVPEGSSLEGAIDALNLHYCCGWVSPVCWPPLTARQAEAVKGLARACDGCIGQGRPSGGPAASPAALATTRAISWNGLARLQPTL